MSARAKQLLENIPKCKGHRALAPAWLSRDAARCRCRNVAIKLDESLAEKDQYEAQYHQDPTEFTRGLFLRYEEQANRYNRLYKALKHRAEREQDVIDMGVELIYCFK